VNHSKPPKLATVAGLDRCGGFPCCFAARRFAGGGVPLPTPCPHYGVIVKKAQWWYFHHPEVPQTSPTGRDSCAWRCVTNASCLWVPLNKGFEQTVMECNSDCRLRDWVEIEFSLLSRKWNGCSVEDETIPQFLRPGILTGFLLRQQWLTDSHSLCRLVFR